jgi:hypothetical protein
MLIFSCFLFIDKLEFFEWPWIIFLNSRTIVHWIWLTSIIEYDKQRPNLLTLGPYTNSAFNLVYIHCCETNNKWVQQVKCDVELNIFILSIYCCLFHSHLPFPSLTTFFLSTSMAMKRQIYMCHFMSMVCILKSNLRSK